MLKKFFSKKLSIPQKDFFIVFVLLFNAFVWYYITLSIISHVLNAFTYMETLILLAVYHMAIIGSSIIGSILAYKIKRLHVLYLWMTLGTCASFLPVLINEFTMTNALGICFFWGVSFGLGMPSCLAYFADYTHVENRGHVGGLIFLSVLLLFGIFDLVANSLTLTIWRAAGLITFLLLKPQEKITVDMKKRISFTSVFYDKSFVLYFIPWLMFCFIDRFEEPILMPHLGPIPGFLRLMGLAIGGLSTFAGGLLSDWIGRKRVVLYGFATLGIAYAIIGIAPAQQFSWYFHSAVVSMATGILWLTFTLILWGDLSQPGIKEKYYVIGNIPFFLTGIIQLLSAPYVMLIPATGAFSLASLFLFLAVLPLLYAPETLPKRKIELRRFRRYVEAARKVKEKYAKEVKEEK